MYYVKQHVYKLQEVVDEILLHNMLSPAERDEFFALGINTPFQGFSPNIAAPNAISLHELLGERWLGERIIDARLELFSADLNSTTLDLVVILPCDFHLELEESYITRHVSPRLKQLQERIICTPPHLLAFLVNKEGIHWAPCIVVVSERLVLEGDSSHFPPYPNLLRMVQWLLADVVQEDGPWKSDSLDVEQQRQRHGSCGLAAVSAIITFARVYESTTNLEADSNPHFDHHIAWTVKTSEYVRRQWLHALVSTAIAAKVCSSPISLGFTLTNSIRLKTRYRQLNLTMISLTSRSLCFLLCPA